MGNNNSYEKKWMQQGYLSDPHDFEQIGEYSRALKLYDQLIDSSPKNAQYHILKGQTMHDIRLFKKALECFQRASQLEPKNHIPWVKQGVSFRKLKEYQEAFKCFDRALSLGPMDATVMIYQAIANVLNKLQQSSQALTLLDEALKLEPQSDMAYLRKGQAYMLLSKPESAMECFDQACSFNPGNGKVLRCQGQLLSLMGRTDEAKYYVQKAELLDPLPLPSPTKRSRESSCLEQSVLYVVGLEEDTYVTSFTWVMMNFMITCAEPGSKSYFVDYDPKQGLFNEMYDFQCNVSTVYDYLQSIYGKVFPKRIKGALPIDLAQTVLDEFNHNLKKLSNQDRARIFQRITTIQYANERRDLEQLCQELIDAAKCLAKTKSKRGVFTRQFKLPEEIPKDLRDRFQNLWELHRKLLFEDTEKFNDVPGQLALRDALILLGFMLYSFQHNESFQPSLKLGEFLVEVYESDETVAFRNSSMQKLQQAE